ncbi:MAG: hypothetical protein WCE44_11870 [Candidatus Velthaea sp.]|jgi:hypothetical protein
MKGHPSPSRRARIRNFWMRTFVWALLAIFVLGSVGAIALIAIH